MASEAPAAQSAATEAAVTAPGAGPLEAAAALDLTTLLLLSVSLDDLTLTEGLGAYGDPEDPLAPFGELARLLEADIDVLPAEGRITGRLGEARRSLFVDLKTGVARVGAQEVRLGPLDWVITPTEIYLRVSAVQRMLPIRIEVAGDELTLRLHAVEKLPVQARLQRLANRPDGSQVGVAGEEPLRISAPYAFVSPPGFDVVLDGGFESGARNRNFRYDVRAAGDLLWGNFQGYLGSDEVGRAANARVLLQRRSLEGNLFGPLRVREVSAGDTFAPGLAIGARVVAGRGLSLSTSPLVQTNVFNRIDLRGDLPPGYDVELYVNDVLKGTTNQAVAGRFEFLDVPLSPGVNIVRLVTYGPRGERNEEIQVVNVGAALLRPGEAQFEFGIVGQDQPVFRVGRRDQSVLGDAALFAPGGTRVVAALNYGVTDLLSLTAGAARIPRLGGGAVGLYTLGARTSLLGLATQVDGGWDSRGGAGVSVGLAGQFGDLSSVLRHAEYRDAFIDENNLGFNSRLETERRTELTLDSSIRLRGRIVPVSMRAIRNDYTGGSHDFLAAWRASSSLGQVLFSAGWEYQRQVYRPAAATETLSGYLSASTFRSYRWQIRTTLDYDILPDVRARFLSVTVDRRLSDAWSLRFGLGQPLDRLGGWNLALSSIFASRFGDLALTGEYDNTDSDWRVAAQWTFGLGWDPGRNRYDLTRTGPGSGGSVLFNAFLDENGDGVRQPGEPPAPNVGLEGGTQRGLVTGKDGRVLVGGLGGGPTAYMDVSLDNMEDASVSTPPSRLELRPRPGAVTRVDYPMRPTGGVTVKVELLRDDGQRVGLASVRVQLAPDKGAPVEAVTEFDGSAVFDAVPIGRYQLQLDPRQAEKLRMRLLQEPMVTIRGGGDFAPDVVVQVKFVPASPETVVAKSGGAN
ncbi:hypothetical protein [uncultured Phenylobacterium sp.]|uniref:hypothetical protein n=1 Tax=uncultured Phenylobacterium sp. TaxID=349273 RepID=UPI0025FBE70F|nr:hypothetical protein [uncultured Phenylobacterium sp.]